VRLLPPADIGAARGLFRLASDDKPIAADPAGVETDASEEHHLLSSPSKDELEEDISVLPGKRGFERTMSSVLARAIAEHGPDLRNDRREKQPASRLGQQLKAEQAAGVRAPTSISSMSVHVRNQMTDRDGGVGVSSEAMTSTFESPLRIRYRDYSCGPTFEFEGTDAAVIVNPDGNVVTAWPIRRNGYKK
jgi:hypothetical protein